MNVRIGRLGVAALSLTALGCLALPLGAGAQDNGTPTDQTQAGTGLPNTPVTLNVESADLYYTLKLLFSQIHADFTLDTSLRGTPVTVKLTRVPFPIALNAVLKASGQPLTYSYENGIFSVIPQVTETVPTTPTTPENTQPDLTANTHYEKIFLNVASVQDIMMALNRPVIQTNQSFMSGGGMGGGFGGGMGGGGMGGMMGGMGGFGGGMGGMGGGMGGFGGGMGGFGGGMGGFGGGFGGGGMGGFGGGGLGGGRGY